MISLIKFMDYSIPMIIIITIIGIIGIIYYLNQPERIKLNSIEQFRIERYIPPVNALINSGFKDAIISGSFAVRLYTDRIFPINNYDIFVQSDNHIFSDVAKDVQMLKNAYDQYDLNIKQTDNQNAYIYNNSTEIMCVIESKTLDKPIQYIITNLESKSEKISLSDWHNKNIDVPVFIKYDRETGEPYFHVRTRFEGFMAKYCNILLSLCDRERKVQYRVKGFWVL